MTSGPGTLANVTFRVVGYGSSNITLGIKTSLSGWNFTGNKEYDIINAETMPTHIQHGYFSNKFTSDIRGPLGPPDGVVDGWDYGFIGLAFGKTSASPDWDDYKIADTRGPLGPPDGVVDGWDYGYCGLQFGQSI